MARKVKDLQDLNEILKNSEDERADFFIALGRFVRSSKSILLLEEGVYSVLNEVDDTIDILTDTTIFDTNITNVGLALKNGRLFLY